MASSSSQLICIIIYLLIIVTIPIILDLLFRMTTQKKRRDSIRNKAQKEAKIRNKPLIIFNDPNHGILINLRGKKEFFSGNVNSILSEMKSNSAVVLISEVLEYLNKREIQILLNNIKRVSDNSYYIVNIEKGSPRLFWDYKIKNIMDKHFYQSGDKIIFKKPNRIQILTQKFYRYLIPYRSLSHNPIIKD